jgi:SnoaL-like domain
MEHTAISPEEAADRLEIRELIDAYAHCADRRDAEGQKALFTENTHFVVYMNGVGTEPTEDLRGRPPISRSSRTSSGSRPSGRARAAEGPGE